MTAYDHDDCDHGCLLGDPRCPKAPPLNMTCPTCLRRFHCPRPEHAKAHECFSCDYARQLSEGEDRFAPLREALTAEGIKVAGVDQTGGMVLCLRVQGPGESWVWFSDFGEFDTAFFGAYRWPEDEGATHASDIPFQPEYAEAIAKWAAPLIRDFFASMEQELTFDEATRAGLDGTGRDLDDRFPYTWAKLTEDEWRTFSRVV